MQFIYIILLCIAAAVLYGVAHDQVTARICIEYFTIGHPTIIRTDSPTLIGLVWGVVATWWMGLLLGVPLAFCCRLGGWPKLSARDLVRPIAVLLVLMALIALAAGVAGRTLARPGYIALFGDLAEAVPQSRHVDFLTALWAHVASYLAGTAGGLLLCVVAIMWRFRRARASKRLARAAEATTTGSASAPV